MTRPRSHQPDIHTAITEQIINAIEAGAGAFSLPWHRAGSCVTRPINVSSNQPYRSVNTVALWAAAAVNDYADGLWGTYRQWQAKGAQVRKGERSSLIVFYKELPDPDAPEGMVETNPRFVAKASRVFNLAQVEGYTPDADVPESQPIDPIAAAEHLVQGTGARIREAGARACYAPAMDEITMPDRDRFTGTVTSSATEGWYSTLLHELTHWSGAKHRLDRQFGERFGDDAYAMEELVAELGAAFLCGDLGVTASPRPDHAAYLEHWLRIMKGDRKAIFTAASAASRAADYLKSLAA
jgi:antirestriction protein ArdC